MSYTIFYGLLSLVLLVPYLLTMKWKQPMHRRLFLWTALAMVGLMLIDVVIRSVRLWQGYANDEVGVYLLPPHSNLVYEHIARLAQPVLVAVVSAAVVYAAFYFARKYLKLTQYDIEDVRWLSLAALASSWPGVLITLVAIFFIAVLVQIIRMLVKRKQVQEAPRLILTPFVSPVTIAIIWFLPDILRVTNLDVIRF